MHEPRATIDFETKSAASLKRVQSWLYAKHPTTRVLCLAFLLPGDDPANPSLWHAGHPDAVGPDGLPDPIEAGMLPGSPHTIEDLFAYIESGGLVEAHNSFFERMIWRHTLPRHFPNRPAVRHEQWRCSAAKAAAYALPRDLDGACEALSLEVRKDPEGKRLIRLLSQPRKPRKGEAPAPEDAPYWNEPASDLRHNWEYCRQDVRAEHMLSSAVPDLSPFEILVWQADQRANERGVLIDLDLARAAIRMANAAKRKMNIDLKAITGIEAGTQRRAIREWLYTEEGINLPDTTAATLDHVLGLQDERISDRARKVIRIARNINRTSTKKFERMIECTDPEDGRARELVMYHGAATGRWTGKGIQVQNMPRGNLGDFKVSIDEAVADVMTGNLEWCEWFYGDVLALLSSVTRGAIIASPGKDFAVADYAAIEARVVLWLAFADSALEVFRRGEDIYCDMASGIYGRPITKKDKTERQFGKVTILGLGYGMGYLTFLLTCRSYKIHFSVEQTLAIMGKEKYEKYYGWVKERLFPTQFVPSNKDEQRKLVERNRQAAKDRRRLTDSREDPEKILHELALMKYTVDTYRTRYPQVKELWALQEAAAIEAVRYPGRKVERGRVTWHVENFNHPNQAIDAEHRFLYCTLPSGRRLVYTDPHLKMAKTAWGEKRPQLRFMGVHKKTKQWSRMSTYGGSIVENIDQATARDMMAVALVSADQSGKYEPVMSVHDELVAEVDEGCYVEAEVRTIMEALPECFEGCPISAEPDSFRRYRK